MSYRQRVVDLYKTLYYMGKEYPQGSQWFHERLKKAFEKNRNVTNPNDLERLIKHGEFVVKEIEALYKLKKYRAMKNRYYPEEISKDKV